eukprot:gene24018-biopygen9775
MPNIANLLSTLRITQSPQRRNGSHRELAKGKEQNRSTVKQGLRARREDILVYVCFVTYDGAVRIVSASERGCERSGSKVNVRLRGQS